MKKYFVVILLFLPLCAIGAQQKYALVIGNSAYKTVSPLANPANDAADINKTLLALGFKVDLLTNASLDLIEAAAVRFKKNLSRDTKSYGFFFYAGHGVQVQGQNYLIPVDADIKSEANVKQKAFNVQVLLDELEEAGNTLNMIVLDACRDNPFGWSRGGTRGLAVVSTAPAGTIVVYATSAGKTAADGTGRNGLFTSQLLKNLPAQGVEVKEVFNRTGQDVLNTSGGEQFPELSIKFFGNAYLNGTGGNTPYIAPPYVAPVVTPPRSDTDKNYSPDALGGVWNGTLEYNADGKTYRDTYKIEFYDDGICDVSVTTTENGKKLSQTGEGYWSYENDIFHLDCEFSNPVIQRISYIKWVSVFVIDGNGKRLKMNVKPAPDYSGVPRPLSLNKGR